MNTGPFIPHLRGEAVAECYRTHVGWLTAAVHCSIAWPEQDVMLQYDGTEFFLRGLRQGEAHAAPCISMRCSSRPEVFAALRKLYRFTSMLGWFKGGYVDVVGHITGTAAFLYEAVAQRQSVTPADGPLGFTCSYMPLLRDNDTARALAFWREGSRLYRVHDGYAFLSFYKVVEAAFDEVRAGRKGWIHETLPTLTDEAAQRVQELVSRRLDVPTHLLRGIKSAVAHTALGAAKADPDVPQDRIRIGKDIVIIRALARRYIAQVMGVPDEQDVLQAGDQLLALQAYLSAEHLEMLRRGDSILRRDLGLNGARATVSLRGQVPPPLLRKLTLSVATAHNSQLALRANNDAQQFTLAFTLDFKAAKAHVHVEACRYTHPDNGGRIEAAQAVVDFQLAVLAGAIVEVSLPNGDAFECEPLTEPPSDPTLTPEALTRSLATLG